ncbi:MAG: hypothetical protein WA008_10755 [Saprospiraceae bacterium]
MPERKIKIAILSLLGIMIWLLSFTLNEWLIETMPRHQLIQLPSMFFIGVLMGITASHHLKPDLPWSIAVLIFVMFSLLFWMIPHSIDYAVISPGFNRIMHANMLLAGFLTISSIRHTIPEVKIIFLGMVAAMIIAGGIALLSFNILLCSAFTIEQQKQTGTLLTLLGIALYFFMAFILFSSLSKK